MNTCPYCGKPYTYQGLLKVECPTEGCLNYVKTQEPFLLPEGITHITLPATKPIELRRLEYMQLVGPILASSPGVNKVQLDHATLTFTIDLSDGSLQFFSSGPKTITWSYNKERLGWQIPKTTPKCYKLILPGEIQPSHVSVIPFPTTI